MKAIKLFVATLVVASMTSCAVKYPITATSNELGTKCGESKAVTLFTIFTFNGDCSVETAAKKVGITKISHVDQKHTSILGIYDTTTTYVYGE